MRASSKDRKGIVDAAIAGVLLVIGLVTAHTVRSGGASDAWYVRDVLIVLLVVPLAWRRRAPRAVASVIVAATAGIWIGYFIDGSTAVAGGIALYGLGRYVERPVSLRFFAAIAVSIGGVAAGVSIFGADGWYAFLARCAVVVASFALGDSQRSRAALIDSLRAQATRAELLRDVEAQQAVTEERGRIAREMHDIVAHSLSVMVVQAVAAERLAPQDIEAAAASMSSVAEVGRTALGEMRRIFTIFDESASPVDFAPQPTLADLDTIVDTYRKSGMGVIVHRRGVTAGLDPGTELAVVRIVQESLTNTLKHAKGADTVVTLTFADDLTIEITDSGSVPKVANPSGGPGRGLLGMRERVEALGGTLMARSFAGRGFAVRAVLPIRPSDAVPTSLPASGRS